MHTAHWPNRRALTLERGIASRAYSHVRKLWMQEEKQQRTQGGEREREKRREIGLLLEGEEKSIQMWEEAQVDRGS